MDKRILVVEDEPDIREAMVEALTDAGFQVSSASNGEKGLSSAISEHPDLILLDIVMPVLDGHGMLKKLRVDPWGKDAKVIMLTSMDDIQNIAHAHEVSIVDYIIKTHSSLDEIVNKVKMILFTE